MTEWKGLNGKSLHDFVSNGYQLVQVLHSEDRGKFKTTYYLRKEKSVVQCSAILFPSIKRSIYACSELVAPYPLQDD